MDPERAGEPGRGALAGARGPSPRSSAGPGTSSGGERAGEQRGDVGRLLGVARAEDHDAVGAVLAPPAASTHGSGPSPNATPIGMSAASPVGELRPS